MRFLSASLGFLALSASGAAAGRSLAQVSAMQPLAEVTVAAAPAEAPAAAAAAADAAPVAAAAAAAPAVNLAEWTAAPAAAPAAAPTTADDAANTPPLVPITACSVAAASRVNRTEVDGSRTPAQFGPMAVPDAFLGEALLTVHAPQGAGTQAVVEVIPSEGHTRVAPGGKATDPAPEAPPLRLTANLAANGSASLAYESRSYANDLTPQAVYVNGMPCDIVPASVAIPHAPPPSEESIPGLASFIAERPLSIRDGMIIGVDGAPLIVKGINWFGYENGQTNPDGLWGNVGNALVADFVNVVWRMQLMGFNTIRLPFSFQQFESAAPKDPKYGGCNPTDDATMAASVTPPGLAVPSPASIPKPRAPVRGRADKTCNEYIPNDSLRNRFFWAMRYIAANGFYVIIDDHLAYDTLALDNPDKWVASWKALAADIGRDPLLKNRVMLDILNEPDSRGIKWTTGGPAAGGMTRLYERAMDAIHAASPSSLMLIEGTGQLGTVAMNWGDGFATDAAVVKAGGVEDARPFFTRLASKPYAAKVVVSPHLYPPTISTHHEEDVVLGAGLRRRLDNSFGYLATRGFCPGGGAPCRKFPVVVGETGSRFTDPLDVRMMHDFAGELRRLKAGVVYWCWNANSGDTGGIVKDDWTAVNWEKVAWMQKAVGLHPWALGKSTAPIQAGSSPSAAAPAAPSQWGANPSFNQGGNNGGGGGDCSDLMPTGSDGQSFTCAQQKEWGKCGEGWMTAAGAPNHGWCAKTCGRC